MARVKLNQNNEISLKTTLTERQIAKFNSLQDTLVIRNGSAYVSMKFVHGILLTIGRQRARDIVNAHRNTVRIYIITSKELDVDDSSFDYIRPIGLKLLLDQLAFENPKRATDYRASSVLLGYIEATHPQLTLEGIAAAKKVQSFKESVFSELKKKHIKCQLSGIPFGKRIESHVHHIIAESVNPALATDKNNLIVIAGNVHDDYHSWVEKNNLEINRVSLKNFAKWRGYNLNWSHR